MPRPRVPSIAVVWFAATAAASLAACGQLLGLDGIDYVGARDASASGVSDGPASVDASLPDGAEISDASPGGDVHDVSVPFDGPTVLAHSTAPQAIAVDDTRLYWIDQDSTNGASVLSIAKDGTGAIATIATAQPSPTDIAVDATNVYWSVSQPPPPGPNGTSCLAMMAPKGATGAAPTCVTKAAFATARMTLSQTSVALLVTGAANANPFIGYATKTAGATFQSVQTKGPAQAIAATNSEIFVGNASGDHVDDVSLPGLVFGSIFCLANCGNVPIADMTISIDGTNVLWVTTNGQVFVETIGSASASGLFFAQLPSPPRRMARDGAYVYVTAPAGSLYAVPLFGADASAPFSTLASGQPAPYGVAVDATNVYWTNGDGTIRAVGAPSAL